MSTQEKCGNCGWFTPDRSALSLQDRAIIDNVVDAVSPGDKRVMNGGAKPLEYGHCNAQYTGQDGKEHVYGHGVLSISPCDAQDDQGLLLHSPK